MNRTWLKFLSKEWNKNNLNRFAVLIFLVLCSSVNSWAQFRDDFNAGSISMDPKGIRGWSYFTGDGNAKMRFLPGSHFASVIVDASRDRRNIWWALIRRRVSENFDMNLLQQPEYELRIEARIRVSQAPRRVNLHLNTQRTTDFHSHLMEFDIPDTINWHTISMTTHGFDAIPGDTIYGQLALMDWGLEKYKVDIDYFRVDIVNTDTAGSDSGVQVPYHPHVPDTSAFANHLTVAQDCIIDSEYPDTNFNTWSEKSDTGDAGLLTVGGRRFIVFRWDLSNFSGKKIEGSGLLELTTWSVQRLAGKIKDFGMVRATEILQGPANWDQKNVTYNSFCSGRPSFRVLNSQMIIDVDVSEGRGSKTFLTISNPVLQRMIGGRTLGIAIIPLGAIEASFYSMELMGGKFGARLHFNAK